MKAHTVAVVKDGNLYVSGAGTRPLGREIRNVADVIKLAQANKVNSIWLVDVPTDSFDWWRLADGQYEAVERWPREERDTPHSAALYSSRARGFSAWSVFVVDLQRDHRWPASQDRDVSAQEWAGVVQFVEDTLDMPLRFSAGTTGLKFLRRLLPDDVLTDKATPPHIPEKTAANFADPTILHSQRFIHAYDRNAAYLAAMQSTPLGVGEADLITAAAMPTKIGNKQHLFSVSADDKALCGHLPHMIRAAGWYDGAIVRAVAERCEGFDPGVYWRWEDSRVLLRGFADALWALRVAAVARGSRLMLDLAKQLYTETFGNLNAQRIGANALYRPHWHAAILAESSRRVLADAYKWRDLGAFAASIDLVLVASNHPNPDQALPAATERRAKLGGYKHLWTVKATDGLIHAMRGALIARNGAGVLAAINHARQSEAAAELMAG